MSDREWKRVKHVVAEAWAHPPAERASYARAACEGDGPLYQEVLSLLASMDQVGDRFETPAFTLTSDRAVTDVIRAQRPIAVGERIGPWEIVRELGRGGMGTVYLAERTGAEFHQRVAIKIVRGGSADEVLVRRFQEERRILATLDHPHIARLIDGGATELGLPYVAMEYVEGLPIDVFCQERQLDVRGKLEVFRRVCLAVHYAHQRLVVHRDLKASNILVTADGTPKLLDFGIAKMLEADGPTDATRTLFRMLTPETASPEQVRGEPVTTTTDVYALGVLLYRLLSGQSPYRVPTGSETELVRAICEQTPEPPSAPARAASRGGARGPIDRDLDRIVLMALRKEPDRRYGTAEQFAEDVHRWLTARPVLAVPDSPAYRARKFVARNRVAVGAAAAFLVAVVGGATATTWQATVARQERNRARHEFNAVRSLATAVLGELHDAVIRLPGSLAARELLIRRATEYLDALSADAEHDIGLRRELAFGYQRLGQVQGQVGFPNLGDRGGARRSYEKSAKLFESLGASSIDANTAVGLSDTYLALANFDSDSRARAARHFEARRLVEGFLEREPSNARLLSGAMSVWSAIGNQREGAKDYAGALALFAKVAGAGESMLALAPDDMSVSRNLSLAYKKMGTENEVLGALDEALAFYEKAMALDRARVARDPGRGLWRLDLSFSHGAIGAVLATKDETRAALDQYRQAVELRRAVVDADPNDDFAKSALARGYERVAAMLGRLGEVDAAMQAQEDRLAVLEKRRVAHPDRDNVWRDQTTASFDAAVRCLTLLESMHGSAHASRAARVRAMLDHIGALQAQWSRQKRAGALAPAKLELDRALERCDRLRSSE
jgi:tetratricopeptide (TPR) repeat protein/predicted Ser/Thr protein kinase